MRVKSLGLTALTTVTNKINKHFSAQLYLPCPCLRGEFLLNRLNIGVSHLCAIFRVICVARGRAGGHLRRVLGAAV